MVQILGIPQTPQHPDPPSTIGATKGTSSTGQVQLCAKKMRNMIIHLLRVNVRSVNTFTRPTVTCWCNWTECNTVPQWSRAGHLLSRPTVKAPGTWNSPEWDKPSSTAATEASSSMGPVQLSARKMVNLTVRPPHVTVSAPTLFIVRCTVAWRLMQQGPQSMLLFFSSGRVQSTWWTGQWKDLLANQWLPDLRTSSPLCL